MASALSVLLGGRACGEAAIDEHPAFVPVGPDHQRRAGKGAAFEQRARLIGQLQAVYDRPPLNPLSLENLIRSDWEGVQYLIARPGAHARDHLRRIDAAEGGGELLALLFGFFASTPPDRG